MVRYLIGALALTGCIQQEAALSRQGLLGGTAKRGGIAMTLSSSTYRETGTQNIAGGLSMTLLDASTIGAGGRFAQQIDHAGNWRGFTRASFGLGPCQVMTCKARMDPQHRYTIDGQLGVERMLIAPDPANPQDAPSMAVELALVYTHSWDEELGNGHFLGVGLGLRIGVNAFAPKRGSQ